MPIIIPASPQAEARALQGLPESAPRSAAFDRQINALRVDNGRGPLVSNAGLDGVAASYAADLVARGVLDHRDRAGRRVTERVRAAGVATCPAGENLAKGYDTAEQAFAGWLLSPGHRANMLHAPYVNYGIGRAGDLWVLVMMLPC